MYLGVVTLIVQTTRRKGSCWGAELFGWVEKMLYVGQPLKATRHQAQVTLIWLMNSRTTRSLQEGKRTTHYSDFPATINNSARLQKCMQSEAGKCSFVKNRFFKTNQYLTLIGVKVSKFKWKCEIKWKQIQIEVRGAFYKPLPPGELIICGTVCFSSEHINCSPFFHVTLNPRNQIQGRHGMN